MIFAYTFKHRLYSQYRGKGISSIHERNGQRGPMPRVLVIDDDPMILNLLVRVFELEGYEVLQANNGKEGLIAFQDNPIDLVVTDIVMPEADGLETIMEIRKNNRDVKIIAISGGGRIAPEDHLIMAKQLGANCTFCKPVERKRLLRAAMMLLA